jgi:hypothetical protein
MVYTSRNEEKNSKKILDGWPVVHSQWMQVRVVCSGYYGKMILGEDDIRFLFR